MAVEDDRAGIAGQTLSRERGEQLVLAVAGDAGDAQDFTTFELQRNMLQPHAMGIVGLETKIVDDQARHGDLTPGGGFHFLDIGADHHARQRCGGLHLGIAGRDFLAAAQDGRGVAKPLHFLQLVADVEHGPALGLEAIQHDEELIGLLRRQHRGRLVEDQEFGILHQCADDFDALALAHRELPDLAFGIERKPVNIGHFLKTRGHVLERFLAVETQRHVFGDGEIVEQREVLKHHADAARARFGRPGEGHLLALPAHLAFAGLDQSIDGFDQGRFAGAVLAEQSMDLLRPDLDIDGVVCEEAAVALGQPDGLKQRRFAGTLAGGRRI